MLISVRTHTVSTPMTMEINYSGSTSALKTMLITRLTQILDSNLFSWSLGLNIMNLFSMRSLTMRKILKFAKRFMNLRTKLMKMEIELHSQQQQMCLGILMFSSLKIPMTFTFTEILQVLTETLE